MKRLVALFLAIFAVLIFISCGGEDSDEENTGQNEQTTEDEVKDETEDNQPAKEDEETEVAEEEETEVVEEEPYACLDIDCVNPDGNTSTDCSCEANYCIPDVKEVSYAGLTPLKCTKSDCDPADASTCPDNYGCTKMPGFVISMMEGRGIHLPETICVPK